ncbi:ChbG/HpnK family deacetylase [Vibrio nigripulchritudo]|uniref:ChbG/HpnK family deacetylase n=1 Tax=Vibrio nigripulchritudo TaxID=28173 RepID=UPI002493958C|nr:ChbG/HpnK family deacetylase [Vibrio nigripulchritudo]BDU37752.1 hypothetical protein TUMSATVNIG2_22210 [Vibrio nigripulchritudo]BDU43472.1 hypothetical protein TUMSATVNIG3_22700 [Vibrio nigripulchritudo]
MKQVIVCADDYGMSEEVDAAILELIENSCISATSCMTLMPDWSQSATQLKPLEGQAAYGLHFDLGEFASLGKLMFGAVTRTLNAEQLTSTLKKQLDRFEDEMNRRPDYLDGHQHVHAFPVVRDVVAKELSQRYDQDMPWVRNPCVPLSGHDSALKAVVIKGMNAGFKSTIQSETKAALNSDFAGLYSISEKADFAGMMEGWLDKISDNGLIMCHPATQGATVEHGLARVNEYDYLMSERYQEYLQANQISLAKSPRQ